MIPVGSPTGRGWFSSLTRERATETDGAGQVWGPFQAIAVALKCAEAVPGPFPPVLSIRTALREGRSVSAGQRSGTCTPRGRCTFPSPASRDARLAAGLAMEPATLPCRPRHSGKVNVS